MKHSRGYGKRKSHKKSHKKSRKGKSSAQRRHQSKAKEAMRLYQTGEAKDLKTAWKIVKNM